MPYAVELFFDARTDAAVRKLWKWLADEGISTYLASSDSIPHISLGGFDDLDGMQTAQVNELLQELAESTGPFPATFTGIEGFVNSGVIFLAPEPSPELNALHERFCNALGSLRDRFWPLYLPGTWVPHCTVAVDLLPCSRHLVDQVRRALSEHIELPWPFTIEHLGLVKFRPIEHQTRFPLHEPTV